MIHESALDALVLRKRLRLEIDRARKRGDGRSILYLQGYRRGIQGLNNRDWSNGDVFDMGYADGVGDRDVS